MPISISDLGELVGYDPESHTMKGLPTLHPQPTGSANGAPIKDAGAIPSMAKPEPAAPNVQGGAPSSIPSMMGSVVPNASPMDGIPSLQKPPQSALSKFGHGLAKVGEYAGDALMPGVFSQIPGTPLNKQFEQNREQKLAGEQAETGLKTAQTGEAEAAGKRDTAEAWSAMNPGAAISAKFQQEQQLRDQEADKIGLKQGTPEWQRYEATGEIAPAQPGKTPAEQTYSDLMTGGPKSGPKVDPQTGQPYTSESALAAVTKAPADSAAQDTARAEKIRQALNLKQPVSPEDQAWLQAHDKEKTLVAATTNVLNQPNKNDERLDKSFQYNNTSLDKIATPLDQTNQRLGRLFDTLNQQNPQADALVGPELLSVMAGGQGSGVRMNEAEIARIVGGRSHWQDLQAAIQKWSTDPKAARSITPDQDQQIRSLVAAVKTKIDAKNKIIDEARDSLIDGQSPKDHRETVAEAKKRLDAIDSGASEVKVQQNSKGEFRHSTDGGKTWQTGKPPQ